jgi:hypothetical protein
MRTSAVQFALCGKASPSATTPGVGRHRLTLQTQGIARHDVRRTAAPTRIDPRPASEVFAGVG